MPGYRAGVTIAAGIAIILLSGCKSSEERAFLAACESKLGHTSAQCDCLNDLISDGLDEKGQSFVRAIAVGDDSKAAQIQSSFGLIEGATILSRAGWVSANAPQACGVGL